MEDNGVYIIKMFYGEWDDHVEFDLGVCIGIERIKQIKHELESGNFSSLKPMFDDEGERSYDNIMKEVYSYLYWDDEIPDEKEAERILQKRFKEMFPDLYDDYMNDDLDPYREVEVRNEIEYRIFKKYYPDLTLETYLEQDHRQRMYEKIQEHYNDDDFGVYYNKLHEI